MRTVEQQLQAAIAMASPLSPLELSLRESRGCVVASDVLATYPIPSFDAAAYDGYAVVASSITGATNESPVELAVVDSVGAGFASDVVVEPGQAVRISAGALLPKGADTVVPLSATRAKASIEFDPSPPAERSGESETTADSVPGGDGDANESQSRDSAPADGSDMGEGNGEVADAGTEDEADGPTAPSQVVAAPAKETKSRRLLRRNRNSAPAEAATTPVPDNAERISVLRAEPQGAGILLAGSHRAAGSHLLAAGTRLGDRELATVAAGGHARIPVHPEPRVVFVTVGDELVDTTRALTTGLVHDAVAVMLVAAGEQAGATTFRGGPSRRDVTSLAKTIEDQLVRADLIVVVGEDDSEANPQEGLVANALKQAGCQDLEYCQLLPGPAIGLGTVGDDQIGVITIGSSALSAFVGFEVLVRPTIAALAGRQGLFRPVVRATLTEAVAGNAGLREFIPAFVRLDAQGTRALVSPLHEPGEQASLWLHRANALAILPEDAASKGDGDEVAVIRLDRE
mgnify:CR=1 FL=1